MSATTTPRALTAPSRPIAVQQPERRTLRARAAALVSSAVAAVLGIAPHVLHHAGPLAGAALLAGTGGSSSSGKPTTNQTAPGAPVKEGHDAHHQ